MQSYGGPSDNCFSVSQLSHIKIVMIRINESFKFENCTPILNLIYTRDKTPFKAGLLNKVKNEFLYRIGAPETDGCQPQI